MSTISSNSRLLGLSAIAAVLFAAFPTQAEDSAPPKFVKEVQGLGDTTLFIPGLTSSPTHFQSAISSELVGQAHWITLAGFAGVPAATASETFVDDAATALVDYIVAEDLTDLQLVGHSLGGVLSLIVAARLPDRIDGVLIVDSVPFLPALFQPSMTEDAASAQANMMRRQMEQMAPDQFLNMMRAGLPRQATSAASQTLVFEDIAASDQATIAIAMSNLMSTDYSSVLPQITAPVTVLVPHNDFIGQDEEAWKARYQSLYTGLTTAEFVIIPDSRHFIQLDQPQAFEEALTKFLEAHNG